MSFGSSLFYGSSVAENGCVGKVPLIYGAAPGFAVSGDSMSPTLNDGDIVMIDYKARFAAATLSLHGTHTRKASES